MVRHDHTAVKIIQSTLKLRVNSNAVMTIRN
jgi:hypothetical protein